MRHGLQILYVTRLWSGLKDLIVRGHSEPAGMPAFLRPLRGLLAAGHRVDMIVATDAGTEFGEVRAAWLQGANFQSVVWQFVGRQRPVSAIRLVRAVNAALNRQRYDFVYGHGALGVLGCLAARRAGVPCGQRLYGVNDLARELEHSPRPAVAVRHPLLYLSFLTKKNFLVITDDGSHGDRAWQRLGRHGAFDFHFWRNGVDRAPAREEVPTLDGGERFLFMPGRITAWKGQHHGLEILRQLHAMGWTDVKLYLAGEVVDPAYWAECERLRDAHGLNAFVRHLGSVPGPELVPYYRHSVGVLAPYEQASLGNVVIEALSAGGIVVAQDSSALNGVISDGDNGIRMRSPGDATNRLGALLADPCRARAMRERALASAREIFEPWDRRVVREVRLIEAHAAQGNV